MPAHPALSVHVSEAALPALAADVLIVPCFDDDDPGALGLAASTQETLAAARKSREFKAKLFELFWLPVTGSSWKTPRVLLIGAGARRDFTSDRTRKLAVAAGLSARGRNLGRVAFLQRATEDAAHHAQAIAEGLILAAYDGDSYKTNARDAGPITDIQVVVTAPAAPVLAAVERGRILGESSNLARRLANEPGNLLTPRVFADRAAEATREVGLTVDVLDEKKIESLKMGMLLGVARGSDEPPRVIVMRHSPPGVTDGPVLGLVGKGVTFDTGGISIKPAEGMDRMKDDMAGGAAVIAAMRAIALLKAPIRVIGVVPTTENMPGGRAIKPGDVLTSASGKTVEVLNTDAEGRLILGDALWYARELGATHLVDVATLTGAIMVALGKTTSGLFATPDWWSDVVRVTADRAGDRMWPMPLFDDYFDQLKSEIADMANIGGRPAGAVTAAMFLKEFSGGLPWAHLDIAGTAWAEDAKPFQPKGATGIAVRTLAELAFTSDRWAPDRSIAPSD
jgi:leucyl aminopeptidase